VPPRRAVYSGPVCPRCGTRYREPLPDLGLVRCSCEQRFEVALFHPPERTSAPAQAVAAGSAPCARHAHNQAVASCEHCGAFMCALCRIDVEGAALCAACFERLSASGTLASARVGFRNYNRIAWVLAVVGLLPFFSVLLGPLSVLAALKGLRQAKRLGESLGTRRARVALVLGSLEAVGGALFWFAVVTGAMD
jgi:hypothetical protein